MKLDKKIVDYLDHVSGYRSVEKIAEAVGSTEDRVAKLCEDLYWGMNNGMLRSIGAEPRRLGEMTLYATKYLVEDG